jgi:hypothetical protein
VKFYVRLFVNRRAYTYMTDNRVDPSKNSYKRHHAPGSTKEHPIYKELTLQMVADHIAGKQTCMFYAINPQTQRSKWICIDGDYENAEEDLLHLQEELAKDHIYSLYENSRRGGHVWILNHEPLPAWDCRQMVIAAAQSISVPLKDAPLDKPYDETFVAKDQKTGESVSRVRTVTKEKEGLEIFPKQDFVEEGGYGNGVRGPLCVHRKNYARYWFRGAAETLDDQFALLEALPKLSATHLADLTCGFPRPTPPTRAVPQLHPTAYDRPRFSIFDHFPPPARCRNYEVVCPSCGTPHLKITVSGTKSGYYHCLQGGCASVQIREALGVPIILKRR